MSIIPKIALVLCVALALMWPSATDAVVFSNQGGAPQPGNLLLYQGGKITLYQGGVLQCFTC